MKKILNIFAVFLFLDGGVANAQTIFEKIEMAKKMADETEVSYTIEKVKTETLKKIPQGSGRAPIVKKIRSFYEVMHRDVALVGMQMDTGKFKTVVFQEAFALETKRRKKETAPMLLQNTDGCEVRWNDGNRHGLMINLSFRCQGEDYAVLRLKRWAVFTSRNIAAGGQGQICVKKRGAELVSYTPYSPPLRIPELIERGKKYIEDVIQRAFEDLADRKISSAANPQEIIGESISLDFPLWFAIDEHMDHEKFFAARREGNLGRLIDEFYAELGANLDDTKRWSISSGDAFGLAQFICPTYLKVLNKYPEAGLNPVFLDGMRDHPNAFKAMVLLWDADMSAWNDTTRKICNSKSETLEECWAASYNSGPGKLNKVIAKRGEKWDQKGMIVKNKRRYYVPALPDETRTYIEKLRAIREYFLKEKQNSP